jgi:predicted transcriptional regulator of viral defense system
MKTYRRDCYSCKIRLVRRQSVLEHLSDLSREQAAYFTAAQARRLGVNGDDLRRLARQGDLRRVGHGAYAFPGSFAGPRENTIVAWLRLSGDRLPWDETDPAAVVSHASAAALHGFGAFVPSAPTFTVFRRKFQPPDGSIRLYTARLEPREWRWVVVPESIELPVTTPERTIVDLAFAGEERDHVLDAVAEARDAGLIDNDALVESVKRRRERRGRGNIEWLGEAVSSS